MSFAEVEALIRLIEDPDEQIFTNVKNKLMSSGLAVIPNLSNAWLINPDALYRNRITSIVNNIKFNELKSKWIEWVDSEEKDLLEAAIILSKYEYPDYDDKKIINYFRQIVNDVWLELNDNLTALEETMILNQIIFKVHGFSGNLSDINHPDNSCINKSIETKKTNPIMLGLIFIYVGRQLNLPIYGINLPQQFAITYVEKDKCLFYINLLDNGNIFGKPTITEYIQKIGVNPKKSFYSPCSNVTIMHRLISQLIYAYQGQNEQKLDGLKILEKILLTK